jgi:hypothetical protein
MIRIAAAILVLGSALAHPFNLDFAQLDAQMKQLEQLSGKLSPYNHLKLSPYTAAAAKQQPQFSAHFSPQSLQFSFGQHSPAQQQYSTAQQQQQQYNPQDYLADPLGSFPVQYSYLPKIKKPNEVHKIKKVAFYLTMHSMNTKFF